MHYLKLERFVHIGHIVANVTFFFTLAIAILGVEIGGRRQENGTGKPLQVEVEREKNPFSPFSSSVFFLRSDSYFAPLLTI